MWACVGVMCQPELAGNTGPARPAPPPAGALAPRPHTGFAAAFLPAFVGDKVLSPSSNAGIYAKPDTYVTFSFKDVPLGAVAGGEDAVGAGLGRLADAGSPNALLDEKTVYELAMSSLPRWVERVPRPPGSKTDQIKAYNLYKVDPTSPPQVLGITMSYNSFPEIPTRSKDPFHPAFTAEVKSAKAAGEKIGGGAMWDEIATYSMQGVLASFFKDVPPGRLRCFAEPPVAYALVCCAHVGYVVAVEWAGKGFMSIVTQPFFLGSTRHEAAVAGLRDHDYSAGYVEIDAGPVATWPDTGEPSVSAAVVSVTFHAVNVVVVVPSVRT